MSFYLHECVKCGYVAEDMEILSVCPDCSSNEITNDVPVREFSDEVAIIVSEDEEDFNEGLDI